MSIIYNTVYYHSILHHCAYPNRFPVKSATSDRLCLYVSCAFLFISAGIAPHCLDPGTVRSVTVENFGGDNWEESMQAHKSIRNMSVATADIQQNTKE